MILKNLKRFYPYESVHAANSFVKIEDKNHEWYHAIHVFLSKYEPVDYFGCHIGYFRLEMDNKITLELDNEDSPLFITYWDGSIYISNRINIIRFDGMYCTVKLKK